MRESARATVGATSDTGIEGLGGKPLVLVRFDDLAAELNLSPTRTPPPKSNHPVGTQIQEEHE